MYQSRYFWQKPPEPSGCEGGFLFAGYVTIIREHLIKYSKEIHMTEQEKKAAYGANYSDVEPAPVNLQETDTSETGDLSLLRSKGVDKIDL